MVMSNKALAGLVSPLLPVKYVSFTGEGEPDVGHGTAGPPNDLTKSHRDYSGSRGRFKWFSVAVNFTEAVLRALSRSYQANKCAGGKE